MDRLPTLQMVGVDTWRHGERDGDDGARSYQSFDLAGFYRRVSMWALEYEHRLTILRQDTVTAAGMYPDAAFDFVFVDADHTEPGVRADIEAWRPKIRPGGWLTGHDIDMPSVRAAVDDLCSGWTCLGEVVWGVQV